MFLKQLLKPFLFVSTAMEIDILEELSDTVLTLKLMVLSHLFHLNF